ncbi:hypothetical protein L7F22_065261, partial [Adiantum nelumboides]|nr:hypothetical protein [Adiantum nelumboides]
MDLLFTSDDLEDHFEDSRSEDDSCNISNTKAIDVEAIDPLSYLSPTYYCFDRDTYNLMVMGLHEGTSISLDTLKRYDTRGMLDLKKWRQIQESLSLLHIEGGVLGLCLKVEPKLRIACIEDWPSIVRDAHFNA